MMSNLLIDTDTQTQKVALRHGLVTGYRQR